MLKALDNLSRGRQGLEMCSILIGQQTGSLPFKQVRIKKTATPRVDDLELEIKPSLALKQDLLLESGLFTVSSSGQGGFNCPAQEFTQWSMMAGEVNIHLRV